MESDNLNLFQRICEGITSHRLRMYEAESVGIEPIEYHYRCRVCRLGFWNYNKPGKK